ncbi:MAG: nucleotide exchange factor GrpE [Dehalococcoidia bacterium]|nr:nucleotide exchange factor GrpE [Dehalococcoidia bacterium]MDW8119145.1 nucleotide exchange factor GrpE [Chloroflexota bacterium]
MTTLNQQPGPESHPAGLPPGPQASEVDRLRADLEEAQRERAQFKALLQRVQADFSNYRKQVEQEREAFQRQAASALLLRLLPALDDLMLAVDGLPQDATSPWAEGVRLAVRKLLATLAQAGLEPLEPVGKPFDPWEHEAVGQETSETLPPGSVLKVTRRGYKFQGRVLRPALVIVSTAQETPVTSSGGEHTHPPQ